jgi:hypothetical protein
MAIRIYIVDEDTEETLYSYGTTVGSNHKGATFEEFNEIIPLLKNTYADMVNLREELVSFFIKNENQHRWGLTSDIRRQHLGLLPL